MDVHFVRMNLFLFGLMMKHNKATYIIFNNIKKEENTQRGKQFILENNEDDQKQRNLF